MTPILDIKNLRITFRKRHQTVYAVRGVDLKLYEKDTLALVGESGCGKSVTAKAILQLLNHPGVIVESGEILYQGRDLLKMSEKEIRKIRGKEIGMIFQDPMTALNPTMKIGDQVLEGLLLHFPDMGKEAAIHKSIELLRLVGIPQPEMRFEQYPHELSGGMRQRVLIAIAIGPSPKILIADEPTTALDVTIQAQILELLREIQEKTGTSILFITHDLSIVSSFCHRVSVMYAGKIVESTNVDKLFNGPAHPYTQRLLASIPRLDQKKELMPIDGSPPDLSQLIPGCSFCNRCQDRMHICAKQYPPQFHHNKEHTVNCWRYDNRVRTSS